jgi:hypothetical protein
MLTSTFGRPPPWWWPGAGLQIIEWIRDRWSPPLTVTKVVSIRSDRIRSQTANFCGWGQPLPPSRRKNLHSLGHHVDSLVNQPLLLLCLSVISYGTNRRGSPEHKAAVRQPMATLINHISRDGRRSRSVPDDLHGGGQPRCACSCRLIVRGVLAGVWKSKAPRIMQISWSLIVRATVHS